MIKNSRISQHLKEQHRDLLHSSSHIGGNSLAHLVIEVKDYTKSQSKLKIDDICKKTPCDLCNTPISCQNLSRHKKLVHNIDPEKSRIQIQNNQRTTAEKNILLSEMDLFLDEYEHFLTSFAGGNNKKNTARSHRLGVKSVINHLGIESIDELINETNRCNISDFLTSESVRIKSGVKRLIEGLQSLSTFLVTNKLSYVSEKMLTSDLESFKNQTLIWTKSFTKHKKKQNAKLRDKLDENLLSDSDVQKILSTLDNIKKIKKSLPERAEVLALYFIYGPGNANRPDVAKNATIDEYLSWKIEYLSNKEAKFKVSF